MTIIYADNRYRPKRKKLKRHNGYNHIDLKKKIAKQLGEDNLPKVESGRLDHLNKPNTIRSHCESDNFMQHEQKPVGRSIDSNSEMTLRELKVQKETERLKGLVTIPYNKGGYQLVLPSEVKDAGKKL